MICAHGFGSPVGLAMLHLRLRVVWRGLSESKSFLEIDNCGWSGEAAMDIKWRNARGLRRRIYKEIASGSRVTGKSIFILLYIPMTNTHIQSPQPLPGSWSTSAARTESDPNYRCSIPSRMSCPVIPPEGGVPNLPHSFNVATPHLYSTHSALFLSVGLCGVLSQIHAAPTHGCVHCTT